MYRDGEEKPKQSRIEKVVVPVVLTGLFVVWPAVNLTTAYLAYKTVDKQIALELLKSSNS